MNLRDLRYLVAVADVGHFGRAAEACDVTQPTLSVQIQKLERELGIDLLERSPRNIMLTPAGERVVERARLVLDEADAIATIAAHARNPEAGTIRVGLFPTLAPYLLPHVVPKVLSRFPDLEVLLVEEKTEVITEQLRTGKLEAGLMALPVDDDHLDHLPLFTEDFVLAVPSSHPLAATPGPIDQAVLASEPMLLLEEGHCLRDQALDVCRLAGGSARRGFRATSLETLRQMVASGVGITLLPELAVQPPVATSEDITLLRFSDPAPSRQIGLFWRRSSIYGELMASLGPVLRDLPAGFVRPLAAT